MRWIPFLIFAYVFVLVQTTLGRIITFDRLALGAVGPDLLVLLAVFIAMNVRFLVDGMLAGWVLGLLIDLTTAGGAGDATRVGPMAILYVLGVWIVYTMREAIFRERALPQMLMGGMFCLLTHGLWVTVQVILAGGTSGSEYGAMMLRVLLSSGYTALLVPLGCFILNPCKNWLMVSPPKQTRRSRR